MAYTVVFNPTLRLVKGSELTWQELDDNFTNINNEFGSNVKNEFDLLSNRIGVLEASAGIGSVTPIQYLTQLLDVNPAAAVAGNVLSFDGAKWTPTSSSALTGLSFVSGTGNLTATSAAGSVVTNLDGRYVQKVNGVLPDATGNVTINLTATQTGTLAARPGSATNGVIYVVSGDSAANNGKTFIYVTASSSWFQVVSYDAATNAATYAPIDSAALTGNVSLTTNNTNSALTVTQSGAGKALVVNGVTNLAGGLQLGGTTVTTTAAQLNFANTVTSNIQTQLDSLNTLKAPKLAPTFTGGVTISDTGLSIVSGPINVAGSVGTIGQVLTSQGGANSPIWQTLVAGGVSGINIQTFTASGTYTPTVGYKYAIAFVTGGGGGGHPNNDAAGGGGGGTAIGILDLATIVTTAVTVGSGGGSLGNGSNSSIATLSGSGGLQALSTSGGNGGSGSGAFVVTGSNGQYSGGTYPGVGGGSFWGSGNNGAGKVYGAGGGGEGFSGKSGVVVIWEFK